MLSYIFVIDIMHDDVMGTHLFWERLLHRVHCRGRVDCPPLLDLRCANELWPQSGMVKFEGEIRSKLQHFW